MGKELQIKALRAGINTSIAGDMPTTAGTGIEKNYEMFKNPGYNTERDVK